MFFTLLAKDILCSIFILLPLKDIVRLTSVCKAFRDLITSQDFIYSHLNHQTTKYALHFDNLDWQASYSLLENCDDLNQHSLLQIPSGIQSKSPRLIDAVNGLFFLSDSYRGCYSNMYIWNPCIQKLKIISGTSIDPEVFYRKESYLTIGVGYQRRTNDYKIVRIVSDYTIPMKKRSEVYSLNRDCWREIDIGPGVNVDIFCSTVFVNDCIHWSTGRWTKTELSFVLAFDMNTDEFKDLKLPKYREKKNGYKCDEFGPYLGVLNGKLALIVCFSKKCKNIDFCTIWIMKEYGVDESWIRQYWVMPTVVCHRCLGLMDKSDLALFAQDGKGMISFDLDLRKQVFKPLEFAAYIYRLTTFKESLVLL